MSYNQIAQMELMNAINSINSEKAIDALWDEGVISSDTIEEWGEEHMRTPYHYETNRP